MFVARYSLVLEKNKQLKYIPFKDSKGLSDKATLEQIDSVTSQFENEEKFLMFLRNSNLLEEAPDKVYIIYKANGETKKLDIIYNSLMIKSAALSVVKQKSQNAAEIMIEKTLDINKFINKIKSYALNPESYRYIKSSKLFPYFIEKQIDAYLNVNKENYNTPTMQAEIKAASESIEYYALKDYKTFRTLFLWEQRYLKRLNDNKVSKTEEYTQMKLVDYYENNIDKKDDVRSEYEKDLEIAYEELSKDVKRSYNENEIEISDDIIREVVNDLMSTITPGTPEWSDTIIDLIGIEKLNSLSDIELFNMHLDIDKIRDEGRGPR